MKARRNPDIGLFDIGLFDIGLFDIGLFDIGRWMMTTLMLIFYQPAFNQTLSEGKNLHELQETVFPIVSSKNELLADESFAPINDRGTSKISNHVTGNHKWTMVSLARINFPNPSSQIPNPRLLPRWSAENLPFFCRIEHDFAKKSAVPFKFRLGSVEYVDWLEGKGSDWRH